jgi:hypothetical protein
VSEFILIKLAKKIGDPRLQNILIAVFDMLLFLGVFMLGMYAANETNHQVKQYCENYNMLPKEQANYSAINLTSINSSWSNVSVPNECLKYIINTTF